MLNQTSGMADIILTIILTISIKNSFLIDLTVWNIESFSAFAGLSRRRERISSAARANYTQQQVLSTSRTA